MRIAVTGATGFLGGLVARTLADQAVPLTLLVRSAARAPQLPNTQVVETAGYADLGANTAALHGASVVFMVSAAESADRLQEHKTFVDAATAAGVKHLVYLSFQNAPPRCDLYPGPHPLAHRAVYSRLRHGVHLSA